MSVDTSYNGAEELYGSPFELGDSLSFGLSSHLVERAFCFLRAQYCSTAAFAR